MIDKYSIAEYRNTAQRRLEGGREDPRKLGESAPTDPFISRTLGSNLQLFRSHNIELVDHGVTFAIEFLLHHLKLFISVIWGLKIFIMLSSVAP